MYQQVRSLAIGHLGDLAERFESIDLDLRKARRVHLQKLSETERTTLADLEKRRTELQADLATIREWLDKTDLDQVKDLDEQAETIATIGQGMTDVDQAIRRLILRPIPPNTPEEEKVMALLRERREADLTELVLSAGDELDLSGLVAGLVGLYQGNQVRIKVRRWGG
jgi:hypothetical protein